jgi:uncharacterized protein YndB with AHSA1/START domain
MTDKADFKVHDLRIARTINARRELVWRLWTEAHHVAQWWGPHGFTNPECSINPKPGGDLRIVTRSPQGEEYLNVGTIQSIDPPRMLVFTVALLNPDGSRRLENLTMVELIEKDEATEVIVQVQVLYATLEATQNIAGMRDGWSESLDKLAHTSDEEGWQA